MIRECLSSLMPKNRNLFKSQEAHFDNVHKGISPISGQQRRMSLTRKGRPETSDKLRAPPRLARPDALLSPTSRARCDHQARFGFNSAAGFIYTPRDALLFSFASHCQAPHRAHPTALQLDIALRNTRLPAMEPAPQGTAQQQGRQQQQPVYDIRNGGHYGKLLSLKLGSAMSRCAWTRAFAHGQVCA